jgi:hypothetical protein
VFFALSKLLVFFTQPSNVLVLLGLVGLALTCTRFARAGWRLAVTSLVLIGLAGFLPLGKALSIPLENRFPQWDPARNDRHGHALPAARRTAFTIRSWVPHRQRLAASASLILAASGFASRASKAALVMIMPFEQ